MKRKKTVPVPRTYSVYAATWITPATDAALLKIGIEQRRPRAFLIREAIQYYLATQTQSQNINKGAR